MQIGALLRLGIKKLLMVSDTPQLDVELLLGSILNYSRSQLLINSEKTLSELQETQFLKLIDRRSNGEPIAYLIGEREFWSLPIIVTPDVLIPRPETELLVELVLGKFSTTPRIKIADLGTGSGAIALAIAHERPHWQIVATDKSEKALVVAKNNAKQLTITNIEFRLGDWTQALKNEKFDAIVSNPPYIPENDPHLKTGDLHFEPQDALVSGVDGIRDLTLIIEQARNYLKPNGWLMVEHGYDQGREVVELFKKNGYKHIQDYVDLSGISRVTVGSFKR